jgi:hypothetical protein
MNKNTIETTAREIVESAWRNEIDTHGIDAANVTLSTLVDYAEGRDDWGSFSPVARARVLKFAAKLIP